MIRWAIVAASAFGIVFFAGVNVGEGDWAGLIQCACVFVICAIVTLTGVLGERRAAGSDEYQP